MVWATGLIISKNNKFYIRMLWVCCWLDKSKCILHKIWIERTDKKIEKSIPALLKFGYEWKDYWRLLLYKKEPKYKESKINFQYRKVYELSPWSVLDAITINSPENMFLADRYQLVDWDYNVISSDYKEIIKYLLDYCIL